MRRRPWTILEMPSFRSSLLLCLTVAPTNGDLSTSIGTIQSLSRSDFVTVILTQNKRRHDTRELEPAERLDKFQNAGTRVLGRWQHWRRRVIKQHFSFRSPPQGPSRESTGIPYFQGTRDRYSLT